MNLTPRPSQYFKHWYGSVLQFNSIDTVIEEGKLMVGHWCTGGGVSAAVFNQHVGIDPMIK
jgi:hypothetical protein